MATCTYLSRTDSSASLSAREFGYLALRWSDDPARNSLTQLAKPPWGDTEVIRGALKRSFETWLFLLALHTASHWAFAAAIPSVSGGLETRHFVDTLRELKTGTEDASREIVLPNGKPVSPTVSTFVAGLTGNFLQDMISDIGDEAIRHKDAFPRIPSRSAERFLNLLKDNFLLTVQPVEVVVLGPVIDVLSNGTIDAITATMLVSHPRG